MLNQIALVDVHVSDHAIRLSADYILHFHRFKGQQSIAFFDCVASLDINRNDRARQR